MLFVFTVKNRRVLTEKFFPPIDSSIPVLYQL
jgi:hypothetical protein